MAGKEGEWARTLRHYLVGQTYESELIKEAGNVNRKQDAEQKCEAWFYAGSKRLVEEDKKTAAEYFEKCVLTDQKQFFEYHSAVAELKFLTEEK